MFSVNGGFTNWTEWSECDVPCGNGTQQRMRMCNNPIPRNAGLNCTGPTIEKRNCSKHTCPPWSNWGECNSTCGPGVQNRTRECRYPPCTKHDIEFRQCTKLPCPTIDFTKWSSWGRCMSNTPNPYRFRTIHCTVIKTGDKCSNCMRHFIPCNETWSYWSPCSVSCGGGNRTRTRNCYSCPDGVSADGREVTKNETLVQTGDCNTHHCPGTILSFIDQTHIGCGSHSDNNVNGTELFQYTL